MTNASSALVALSATVFDNQYGGLIGVVVANGKHAKRPAAQRDRVARSLVRDSCLQCRRVGRRPVFLFEPVEESAHSVPPIWDRDGGRKHIGEEDSSLEI
jgi:hypothetical protein